MSFSSLPQYTQDIIMVNFEFFSKIFLVGFFFVSAIIFINFYRERKKMQLKKQEESPYLLLDLSFKWVFFLSWIYIFITPLFIVWFYPQQNIEGLLKGTFTFYRLSFILIGTLLMANIFWYGSLLVAKLSGVRIMSKKADRVLDQLLETHKNLFKRR